MCQDAAKGTREQQGYLTEHKNLHKYVSGFCCYSRQELIIQVQHFQRRIKKEEVTLTISQEVSHYIAVKK